MSDKQYVTTGEVIGSEAGFLRGHGTLATDGKLQATVSGFVQRVNKLVSVHALNSRYQGEIGDVVVARIVEVAHERWRVDCNSRQNAVLMLAAVHLPGGVQRRRTHEDSLNMREYYQEGDLISAEVQNVMHDGAISLHTRYKYGRLSGGMFLSVPANLIKRCKQHFHSLPCNVDIILGNNGYVWLCPGGGVNGEKKNTATGATKSANSANKTESNEGKGNTEDVGVREAVCRVRNSIVALGKTFISIYVDTIMDVYNTSLELGLEAKDLLNPELRQRITQVALKRMRHQASEEQ